MWHTELTIWKNISNFARELGISKELIERAKLDYNNLIGQYAKTRRLVYKRVQPSKLDASLSMQEFYRWGFNYFPCFFQLIFSGLRYTGLRESRFYLEASIRAYHIDSTFREMAYADKVKMLNIFKPYKSKEDLKSLQTLTGQSLDELKNKIRFEDMLKGLPQKKEITMFYSDLCNYVHLSEKYQTEALRDNLLNIALQLPEYEKDKTMLQRTFDYSICLLLQSLNLAD